MKRILGIDLGTTNSVVSIVENGVLRIIKQKDGKNYIRSVIAVNKVTGDVVVGETAEKYIFEDDWTIIRSVKSSMGNNSIVDRINNNIIEAKKPSGGFFTPVDVSALYLKELKLQADEVLGYTTDSAIITVPAYFNDKERKATKQAAKLAEINLEKLINEPTAAALEYSYGKGKEDIKGNILVYDFGGGTFDVSIFEVSNEGKYEVLSTDGDKNLGGDDIDKAIFDYLSSKIRAMYESKYVEFYNFDQRVFEAGCKAKIDLSFSDKALISLPFFGITDGNSPVNINFDLTIEELNELMKPIIEKTIKITLDALGESKLSSSDLTSVILVGGSTRIPLVRELVSKALNKNVNLTIDPDEAIAKGAAIEGASISGQIDEVKLVDALSHDLGIELYGGAYEIILKKNTPFPVSKSKEFTNGGNAKIIDIPVVQGKLNGHKRPDQVGTLELRLDESAQGSSLDINVNFKVDIDGTINVNVLDKNTGKQVEGTINNNNSLTDDEIDKGIIEINNLRS